MDSDGDFIFLRIPIATHQRTSDLTEEARRQSGLINWQVSTNSPFTPTSEMRRGLYDRGSDDIYYVPGYGESLLK